MNTLTPRQYLIQITLLTLTCQPSSQISKALCELHYGQSYIKFKTHPQIAANGVALFKRQTICIPYCNDVGLVFKRRVSSKSQTFLGHYQIEVDQYLQKKIYFLQTTQKLIQTQTYITFQCKILNKQTFAQSQTQDLSQISSIIQRSQYSMFDQDPVTMHHHPTPRQSHSEYNGGRRASRQLSPFQKRIGQFANRRECEFMLNEEFGKKLFEVEEIVKKKKMLLGQKDRVARFERNQKGELKSQKIQKLQKMVKTKNQQRIFNSLMVYVIAVFMSLYVGIVIAT